MIAAIVNALGILIGGTLGTLLRSNINHKLVDCLMTAMGLVVVSVGVQGIVGSTDTMCLVLCLAIGAIIGQALRIDEFIDGMGVRVAKLFEGKKFAEGRFADGVISASVMFTVGAMAIMGSLDAGLRGSYSVLFTKTAIDGVAAAAMSAAMGIGVVHWEDHGEPGDDILSLLEDDARLAEMRQTMQTLSQQFKQVPPLTSYVMAEPVSRE